MALAFVIAPLHAFIFLRIEAILVLFGANFGGGVVQNYGWVEIAPLILCLPLLIATLYARDSLARRRVFGARLIPLFFGGLELFGFALVLEGYRGALLYNSFFKEDWIETLIFAYAVFALPFCWSIGLILWAIFLRAPRPKPRRLHPLDDLPV